MILERKHEKSQATTNLPFHPIQPLIALALAAVACQNTVAAADIVVGEEVLLVADGGGKTMGSRPAVAYGTDHYLVVWSEGFSTEGGRSRILATRVSDDGKAIVPKSVLNVAPNDHEEGFQERPRVAFCKGTFLIVWQDFRNGKDYDILGSRISSDGTLLDAVPFSIAGGGGTQARPDIATDGNGFLVVFQSHANSSKQLGYKTLSVPVNVDGAVGVPNELIDQPQPVIAWNGESYLVAAAGEENGPSTGNIFTRLVDTSGKPNGAVESIKVPGRNPTFSISGQPGRGWLIVTDRVRPDAWGWAGPGASRCFFVESSGQLSANSPAEPATIALAPPNWLDMSIKSQPTGLTPLGMSASIWAGQHFVVVWQRFRISYKGYALPLDDCNLMSARVNGWKPIDDKGIPVAASPAEETSPALACSTPGKLLLVYAKGMPDGTVTIAARALRDP